jgi:hypothetical protein
MMTTELDTTIAGMEATLSALEQAHARQVAAQCTASAHHQEATADGAQTDAARVGRTRQELIQWVSVYGDEVDPLASRERPTQHGSSGAAATPGLASREALIQWVSIYGDEVVMD